MNGASNYVRVNISLPSDLVKELKKKIPFRGISRFISDAAREKVENMSREDALKELLSGPPAFPQIKDSVKWVRELRRNDLKRLKRLGL